MKQALVNAYTQVWMLYMFYKHNYKTETLVLMIIYCRITAREKRYNEIRQTVLYNLGLQATIIFSIG